MPGPRASRPRRQTAFRRAEELAAEDKDPTGHFVSYYGLWLGSISRAELGAAREIAGTFLHRANSHGRRPEFGGCATTTGNCLLLSGRVHGGTEHLEEALRICDPERDRDIEVRFGIDTGFAARAYLAPTAWILGDAGRARRLIDEAVSGALETRHVPSLMNAYAFKSMVEILRGDAGAALAAAEPLVHLSRDHGVPIFFTWGLWSAAWAKARLDQRDANLTDFRQVMIERDLKLWAPFYDGLLAELEAETEGPAGALTRVEDALACSAKADARWTDAFFHRVRGEILWKCDRGSTVPAEDAFLKAIAIAQQQKAKSFELRAALSLARLRQSSGRPAQAHAVLAPALAGFSPTPEFSEIAEAQALLAALV